MAGKEARLLSLWEHARQAGALPRLPLEKQGFSVIKGGKREWRVHRDSGEPQHGDRITLLEAKEFRMFPAQVGTLMIGR